MMEDSRLFAARINPDLPELDLHGWTIAHIDIEIDRFLVELQRTRQGMGRIIYGGGTGKLGFAVRACLHKHPMVVTIEDEGASCIVFI